MILCHVKCLPDIVTNEKCDNYKEALPLFREFTVYQCDTLGLCCNSLLFHRCRNIREALFCKEHTCAMAKLPHPKNTNLHLWVNVCHLARDHNTMGVRIIMPCVSTDGESTC